ncbi:MAG: protein kinase domain-containing protein [Vicinamibacterales bacterium]
MTIGESIGPYRVLAKLGEGGMGEVYRANDPKLNRNVAIKVLHTATSDDPDAQQRLLREARAAAALNHPNVCTIHEVGKVDEQAFIIMELVEGPSLDTLIPDRGLPIDQVVTYGRALSDALSHAHDRGIVHRDLKPANIKITPDGVLKVLDFGLAKAEPKSSDQASTDLTRPGTVLGTPAYMSPEQAEGKAVDKRTDIWAFGIVIYQMITGRVPFAGDSFAGTLAAVLTSDPDWTRVPPSARRMLATCLEKDAKRRLRDVGDAWKLFEQPADAPTVATRRWLVPAGVVLGLALGASFTWSVLRTPPATPSPVMRWSITLVEPGGGERGLALSRDGRLLAYTGRVLPIRPIWVRALDEEQARPIPGTEGGRRPFFSPDGKWLAYFSGPGRGSLMKVSLAGGAPTRLCNDAIFVGGSWGDDDHIIFTGPNGLARVSASGGSCQSITTATRENETSRPVHRSPQILPGGKAILFGIASSGAVEDSQIAVLDLASREQRVLEQRGTRARYLSSGHLVYTRNGTMFAVPFDLDRLQSTGPELLAIDGVLQGGAGGGQGGAFPDYAVSESGTLVYTSAETSHRTLSWIERGDGTTVASPAPQREFDSVSLSPDGRRAATFLTIGGSGIMIVDLERGTVSQVAPAGSFPVWTLDGTSVVYSRGAANSSGAANELLKVAADGSDTPQLLASETYTTIAGSVSPDGATLAFTAWSSPGSNARRFIKLLSLNGRTPAGASAPLFGTSNHSEHDPRISPDGKWIAYVSDESGTNQVYLRSYYGQGGKVPISIDGGQEPRWSRNPQELFFRKTTTSQLMTAEIPTTVGAPTGRPRAVIPLGTSLWDVAPDGKRFLVVKDPDPGEDSGTVRVVVNWHEELKRLVPTR